MKLTTLADIIQLSPHTPLEKKVVEGVLYSAPLFSKLAAKTVKGTAYMQRVRTSLPLIGATPYNTGAKSLSPSYETKKAECYPYSAYVAMDKKLIASDPAMFGDYETQLLDAGIKGILASLEYSAIYGRSKDKYGMHGLTDMIGDYMTISATGTNTSHTPGGASVWAICNEVNEGPTVVWGNSKTLSFGKPIETMIPMATADGEQGQMPCIFRSIEFHVGMAQMASDTSARLVNVTANNPLTDELLEQLTSLFPAGRTPSMLVMNRTALRQLRNSRSQKLTYLKKGQGSNTALADLPKDFDGLPIYVTDMLLDDETPTNIAALGTKTELKPNINLGALLR